jgi:hypothetical protein
MHFILHYKLYANLEGYKENDYFCAFGYSMFIFIGLGICSPNCKSHVQEIFMQNIMSNVS